MSKGRRMYGAEVKSTAQKCAPIRLDRVKVYGGDDSLKRLRSEFVLDASYDHYLGEIVDKVVSMIADKYPDGLPEDVRHIHSFDNGSIHALTQGKDEAYMMVLWRDEQFQDAIKPVLSQVQKSGKQDDIPDVNRDIVFDINRLTEWKIPEVVA